VLAVALLHQLEKDVGLLRNATRHAPNPDHISPHDKSAGSGRRYCPTRRPPMATATRDERAGVAQPRLFPAKNVVFMAAGRLEGGAARRFGGPPILSSQNWTEWSFCPTADVGMPWTAFRLANQAPTSRAANACFVRNNYAELAKTHARFSEAKPTVIPPIRTRVTLKKLWRPKYVRDSSKLFATAKRTR
jgi:hypothetical protein